MAEGFAPLPTHTHAVPAFKGGGDVSPTSAFLAACASLNCAGSCQRTTGIHPARFHHHESAIMPQLGLGEAASADTKSRWRSRTMRTLWRERRTTGEKFSDSAARRRGLVDPREATRTTPMSGRSRSRTAIGSQLPWRNHSKRAVSSMKIRRPLRRITLAKPFPGTVVFWRPLQQSRSFALAIQ
jgi:hypothetical protein